MSHDATGAHDASLTAEEVLVPQGHVLRKAPAIAFIIGAVGLVASLALAFGGSASDQRQFYFSWLVAFMYFLSLALGGLFFVLIQFVTRAGWSVSVRRVAENAMATLPLFALLFVPILAGMLSGQLFEWTDAAKVQADPFLRAKAPYLNPTFFIVRAVVYFTAWGLIGWWYRRRSVEQDTTGDDAISRRLQKLAGPCLPIFALTVTFAAFDWLMSLEPHWYSTIFGGYYFAGCVIAIHAVLIIAFMNLQASGLVGRSVTLEHFHDLGKMLFAFVVFWAYMAFSQFMLIWYANLPEETVWYHQRMQGSWKAISVVLLAGHFLIPFFYLIPRAVKRSRVLLYLGAVYMLAIHFVDLHWIVMPVLHPDGASPGLLDLTTFLAIGGFFHGLMLLLMGKSALVPVNDPRLHEALAFENF